MEKIVLNEINHLKGIVLGIGIENAKFKQAINQNRDISTCYLLEEDNKTFNKKKLKLTQKSKTVNIKKLRKTFKKKRIDNLICNYKTIRPFLKHFIRDSIYITKGKIYIYGNASDYDVLTSRYVRYTDKIKIKEKKEKFLIIIDGTDAKNNKIKDIGYVIVDTFCSLLETLTSILVN